MTIGPYKITHDGLQYVVRHDGCVHYYQSHKYLMADIMRDTRLDDVEKKKVMGLEGMKVRKP
jgi:hypothetical protein